MGGNLYSTLSFNCFQIEASMAMSMETASTTSANMTRKVMNPTSIRLHTAPRMPKVTPNTMQKTSITKNMVHLLP